MKHYKNLLESQDEIVKKAVCVRYIKCLNNATFL